MRVSKVLFSQKQSFMQQIRILCLTVEIKNFYKHHSRCGGHQTTNPEPHLAHYTLPKICSKLTYELLILNN